MSEFAVVGAGHAGVEAASALAAAGHSVDLLSDESGLPYFRPRLIAVAFGQAEPGAIAIKPEAFYANAGITLRHEAVTQLEAASRTVNGKAYDGIVLAQGSKPFVPPFQGESVGRLMTLWTLADALRLRAMAQPGKRLTVIGGGVLGLEAALRAVMAGLHVTVVEAAPCLLGGVLGKEGEGVLRGVLEAKGIALRLGCCVASVGPDALTLANGSTIPDEGVLCSAGARPNVVLAEAAGFKNDCGLRTQPDLSLAPRIYAAGDLARPTEARPVCAVRRASAMGALAAKNLLAECAGQPTQAWADVALPLFMKVGEVEFHTLGEVRATDVEERRVDDGSQPGVWQSVLFRGEKPVGLRWVGTRTGFTDWERRLA